MSQELYRKSNHPVSTKTIRYVKVSVLSPQFENKAATEKEKKIFQISEDNTVHILMNVQLTLG